LAVHAATKILLEWVMAILGRSTNNERGTAMAIVAQEVTLRIVYDDSEFDGSPRDWAWKNSLTVGHANVGHAFEVVDVRAGDVERATGAEAVEFVTR
jgi:hypothetical protein